MRSLRTPHSGLSIEHVVVVVPARDEEALVGRCLGSLQSARQAARAVRPDLTVDLVLVLDRCTDGTRSVALGHLDVRLCLLYTSPSPRDS